MTHDRLLKVDERHQTRRPRRGPLGWRTLPDISSVNHFFSPEQEHHLMAIRLSLGLTKKLGLPAYSSVGASCHLECELDASALHADAGQFHAEAQRLFDLCQQAVHEQLGREIPTAHAPVSLKNGHVFPGDAPTATAPDCAPDGLADPPNGAPEEVGLSQRQLAFIQDLATQIQGLGLRRLPVLVALEYDKNLTELSSPEASRLINLLRQVRSGKVALDAVLQEDTAER